MTTSLKVVSELEKRVATISTPAEALSAADCAKRHQDAFGLIGETLATSNDAGALYLKAYWIFGDLVLDNPSGYMGNTDDTHRAGTKRQRQYARDFRREIEFDQIDEYRPVANENGNQVSISGCMSYFTSPDTIATKYTGDQESYTPPKYIEAAYKVMGGIDLDPASCDLAQKTVNANYYFTEDNNGLMQDWSGRVWMNPPYTIRLIDKFIAKLIESYNAGKVTQAVLLTNNSADTGWFHAAAGSSSAILLTRGRINFLKPDGTTSSPTNGQAFFYFGNNPDKFAEVFAEFGLVVNCYDNS